jgi:hypothetical protein
VRGRRSFVLAASSLSFLVCAQTSLAGSAAAGAPGPPGRPVVAERAGHRASDGLVRALASGRIDRATYALQRARALFDLGAVRAMFGDVAAPGPRDATMVLRDLVLAYDGLTAPERRVADSILARPTDGAADTQGDGYAAAEATPHCTADACFHWVATTPDAPPAADNDADGVPDQVEATADAFRTVWDTEVVALGFRSPKSDSASSDPGPSDALDVYLAQTGEDGIYGYCTTDDPNIDPGSGYRFFDASAYCVIDNDFAELGGLAAMQVTLAHEFFHAVQFAYDITEDTWFMEATAVWMEDEVFDDVNDNVKYLDASPIARPRVPLDSNNTTFGVYGDWIFFRFISELFGTGGAHSTEVVRRAWELADGAPGGPDRYSLKAVSAAVRPAGMPFREVFARFGMSNTVAPAAYDEGEQNAYPVAPPADRVAVTARGRTYADTYRTRHLTNTYVEFVPRAGVGGSAKLRIVVELGAYRTGPEASVVTVSTDGGVASRRIALNADGVGMVRVAFGRGTVAAVDLVLSNASIRTDCWADPDWRYSCAGDPRDDGALYRYGAALVH